MMKKKLLSLFLIFLTFTLYAQSDTVKADDTVYNLDKVDVKPAFPGGENKFFATIYKNFRVPEIDKDGVYKVYISFIIEKDGSMSSFKIAQDPGYGLGEEGLRVFKTANEKWSPAILDGKPVRTSLKCPVVISIKSTK